MVIRWLFSDIGLTFLLLQYPGIPTSTARPLARPLTAILLYLSSLETNLKSATFHCRWVTWNWNCDVMILFFRTKTHRDSGKSMHCCPQHDRQYHRRQQEQQQQQQSAINNSTITDPHILGANQISPKQSDAHYTGNILSAYFSMANFVFWSQFSWS